MKTKILKLASLLGAAALAAGLTNTAVAAGTASSNLTVTATVAQTCTITAGTLAFGSYDPVSTNSATGSDLTASASAISVTCSSGSTGITVGLGLGSNASGSTRQMLNGAANYLTYELYLPSAMTAGAGCTFPGTTVWNSTNLLTPPDTTWDNAAHSFNVCGTVAKGQTAPAGSYTDTVSATVNF